MMNLPNSREILDDPYYANVEQRLTRISLGIGAVVVVVSSVLLSGAFAFSFLLGAVLSYYNFLWMKQGVDRLLEKFQSTSDIADSQLRSLGGERRIIFKYFIRYALIGGSLYVIFRLRFLDVKGAIFGLFLFVAAVLTECVIQVLKALFEEWHRART
jgi:hypothetical protein